MQQENDLVGYDLTSCRFCLKGFSAPGSRTIPGHSNKRDPRAVPKHGWGCVATAEKAVFMDVLPPLQCQLMPLSLIWTPV